MNVKVSHSCPFRSTVYRDPKAAQGTSKTDCGGAAGWQPNSTHNSIWQGKPACWGRPGVQPRLPGPPGHQERWPQSAGNTVKPALSMSSRAKVQSQPRSSPHWGNGRTRAQWETFKMWCGLGTCTKTSAASPKTNTVLTSTPSPSGWDLGGLAAMKCEVADASPPTAEVLFPSRTVRMNTHCCNVEKLTSQPKGSNTSNSTREVSKLDIVEKLTTFVHPGQCVQTHTAAM